MDSTQSKGIVTAEFKKVIDDFTSDIAISYPEYKEYFDEIDYESYFHYCKSIYPENFFNILYENDEVFQSKDSKYLLPNIDFEKIMHDELLSEQSKKTIWKYLQLVLFSVCNNTEESNDFGDAKKLFEAIDEKELHSKIQDTMNEMKKVFMNMDGSMGGFSDISNMESFIDMSSGNPFFNGAEDSNDMFDADKLKDHLSGIMGGKIGNLAKEIAEEASKDLGLDGESMSPDQQQDFMKNLFKNPTKIMNIVKNIGTKIEEKFKSGDLKESELLEEAQEIMGKMQDLPGLKNMMSSMGMNPGGKFDFKGMANKMQQNMKYSKMKERMQEKRKKNEEQRAQNLKENFQKVQENTFVWNDDNSNPNEPMKKSSSKPKSKNNKKKSKAKKKNKN